MSEKYIPTKTIFDRDLRNRSFGIDTTIMEANDNSLANDCDEINILIQKENYKPLRGLYSEDRLSYIVVDNGSGYTGDLNDFFEKSTSCRKFTTKEEYYSNSGYYGFGNLSHSNISSDITFYTKTEAMQKWIAVSLVYDEENECALKTCPREMNKDEIAMFERKNINLHMKSGSILYVKGINNTEVYPYSVEEMSNKLLNTYGLTYFYEISKDKNNKVKMTINGQEVKPVNPLGLDLVDPYIMPKVFGKYSISLKEVLDRLNDSSLTNNIYSEYLGLFTMEELMEQSITVTLVAINHNISNRGSKYQVIKRKYTELDSRYFPSYDYSGFYIRRNNRYIGMALGMLGIVVDHPDYTRFRGEISFHPCFDKLFKIEANKNRNMLLPIIKELIQERINKDTSLSGNTTVARIKNSLKDNVPIKKSTESNQDKYKSLLNKSEAIQKDFAKYNERVEELDSIISSIKSYDEKLDFERIRDDIKNIELEYKLLYKTKFCDISNIIARLMSLGNRKYLSNTQEFSLELDGIEDILCEMGSPLQEGEMANICYLLYKLAPDRFDFRLLDYNTDEGLDCISAIDDELWKKLNMGKRFGKQYEMLNKIAEEQELLCTGEKISLMEYKIKLNKNFNHSMMLVSHIVCWEKTKGLKEVVAEDATYYFDDNKTKDLLRSKDATTVKEVKVIYLKEIIESICECKFKSIVND